MPHCVVENSRTLLVRLKKNYCLAGELMEIASNRDDALSFRLARVLGDTINPDLRK